MVNDAPAIVGFAEDARLIAATPTAITTDLTGAGRALCEAPLAQIREMDPEGLGSIVRDVLLQGGAEGVMVSPLRARGSRWTWRLSRVGGEPVVLKAWRRSKWPAFVYRAGYRRTTAYREWQMPGRLAECGVRCARSLAYFIMRDGAGAVYEAVVLEDLGECESSMMHLKTAAERGDAAEIHRVNELIVDMTARLVEHGFVDTDHSMTNLVFTPDGSLARLDMEHCQHVGWRMGLSARKCGEMLGVLIGTYAYAVQPRVQLAVAFGHALAKRVRVPQAALNVAQRLVDRMMSEQAAAKQIHSHVELGW